MESENGDLSNRFRTHLQRVWARHHGGHSGHPLRGQLVLGRENYGSLKANGTARLLARDEREQWKVDAFVPAPERLRTRLCIHVRIPLNPVSYLAYLCEGVGALLLTDAVFPWPCKPPRCRKTLVFGRPCRIARGAAGAPSTPGPRGCSM